MDSDYLELLILTIAQKIMPFGNVMHVLYQTKMRFLDLTHIIKFYGLS